VEKAAFLATKPGVFEAVQIPLNELSAAGIFQRLFEMVFVLHAEGIAPPIQSILRIAHNTAQPVK
jgi:hypothetical protein